LAISLIFAKQLEKLFSHEQNPIFMTFSPEALKLVSIGFILVSFQIKLSSVYQAVGYAVRSFLVAMSSWFILFIPIVFIFTSIWGVTGIFWYTFMISDILVGLLSFIVYEYELRDLKRKIPLLFIKPLVKI